MTARRVVATMDRPMTRKPTSTADPAQHRASVRQASIQYVRTGDRRPTVRKVSAVPGVRPFFA
jgi:hypothetical protein